MIPLAFVRKFEFVTDGLTCAFVWLTSDAFVVPLAPMHLAQAGGAVYPPGLH